MYGFFNQRIKWWHVMLSGILYWGNSSCTLQEGCKQKMSDINTAHYSFSKRLPCTFSLFLTSSRNADWPEALQGPSTWRRKRVRTRERRHAGKGFLVWWWVALFVVVVLQQKALSVLNKLMTSWDINCEFLWLNQWHFQLWQLVPANIHMLNVVSK